MYVLFSLNIILIIISYSHFFPLNARSARKNVLFLRRICKNVQSNDPIEERAWIALFDWLWKLSRRSNNDTQVSRCEKTNSGLDTICKRLLRSSQPWLADVQGREKAHVLAYAPCGSLTVGEGKKAPSVVADGKKAAAGRAECRTQASGGKRSSRDELGGAALHSKQII